MKTPHEIARETAEKIRQDLSGVALDLETRFFLVAKAQSRIEAALTAATQEQAKELADAKLYAGCCEDQLDSAGLNMAQQAFNCMRFDAAREQEGKA